MIHLHQPLPDATYRRSPPDDGAPRWYEDAAYDLRRATLADFAKAMDVPVESLDEDDDINAAEYLVSTLDLPRNREAMNALSDVAARRFRALMGAL